MSTVKIKRSGTTTSTPSSLDYGELAINYADATLFWKDSSNVIQSFVFQAYASAAHKSQHATGGSDALTPADIGAAPAASPTFTGVVSLADGSVGSPSLVGTDGDSGMWFPAGNTVAWSTNGKEALRIDNIQRVRVQQTAADGTGVGRLEWMNHSGVVRGFSILYGDSYAVGTAFTVGAAGFVLGNLGGDLGIGTATAHATRIGSNGLTRIYVASGGNVGIGTNHTSPASALDVNGVITVSATSGSAGSYAPSVTFSGDPNTGFGQVSGQSDTASVFTAGHERVRVDASGRVGIGTTPGTTLHVASATGRATPTPTEIRIATTSAGSDWSTTDSWGRIGFYSADTSGNGPATQAAIEATSYNAAGSTSRLQLKMWNGTAMANCAEVKHTGAVRFIPRASDPADPEAGDVYYNSSTNKLRVYDGTSWVDLH